MTRNCFKNFGITVEVNINCLASNIKTSYMGLKGYNSPVLKWRAVIKKILNPIKNNQDITDGLVFRALHNIL